MQDVIKHSFSHYFLAAASFLIKSISAVIFLPSWSVRVNASNLLSNPLASLPLPILLA